MTTDRHKSNGSMRLRTAIIGAGRIAEQHLEPLARRPDVEVVGICDLSAALTRFTAERFGISRSFGDYREMLDQVAADVVHVLTPAATHVPIVQECIERHLHVIVEKPIALSNADFQVLWRHASARNLRLVENHNYRFNAPIVRLHRLVAEGRIGSVEEVEVRMALDVRAGGRYADANLPHPSHQLPAGVIHEFISHLCYLLLHFLPEDSEEPSVAHAQWRNRGGGELFKFDDLDALVVAGPAHGRIRFSSHQWPDSFSVELRGTGGVASAELFHPCCRVASQRAVSQHLTPLVNSLHGATSIAAAGVGSVWRKVRNWTPYQGLARFLDATYDALISGSEPPVSYEQMDGTTRLIDALLEQEVLA